jgi:Predicted membrane protein
MSNFIVTADGGLTGMGYAICIVGIILLLVISMVLIKNTGEKKKLSSKQLGYCGMAIALGYICSYLKIINMPYGGSVTLFSMLFICLIGYWYGLKVGLMTGLAYGILQFLQEPYVLTLFQVCCDYLLAFTALGLSGLFTKSKNGLLKGYIVSVIARGFFHSLGGYLYWMNYMPDDFPAQFSRFYPIVYNYSYLLAEGAITLAIISLPPVKEALAILKKNAIT